MRKISAPLAIALLAMAACSNEGNSVGNGPGDADGFGNRKDPPSATTSREDAGANASSESAAPNTPSESTLPPPTDADTTKPDEH